MTIQTQSKQAMTVDNSCLDLSQFTHHGETFTVVQLKQSAAPPPANGPLLENVPAGQTLVLTAAAVAELRQHLLAMEAGPPGDPVGKVITRIRALRPAELADLDWLDSYPILTCPVLELSDGTYFYPVRDEEGNGPGCLWGRSPTGQLVTILL
ncbi:MAG TPA: hypothetical protein VGD99_11880, partial [Anaerolineae bacterium]